MKPTEQHVSDKWLNDAIKWARQSSNPWDNKLVLALLELKQRRAIDRQRENDGR
jgi:hypothetical protein